MDSVAPLADPGLAMERFSYAPASIFDGRFCCVYRLRPAGSTYTGCLNRIARCPVFNRTVRYFVSLSGIKMIVIPDNARVNDSIFGPTASVRYFGESHQSWQPYA